ncbi:MAG: FprA family A-type flavoprotein [Actinomycetia bacterium]|nr:FprA family A-type flavoprotein [Actinomycetes bacterium]
MMAGALELKKGVYAVGALDPDLPEFDEALTPYGTTYNSYLVVDEQVTLIDFVRANFAAELLENIASIIGDRLIDNIIVNHCEPDHSGALPAIVKAYPAAQLYGTANAQKALAAYYPDSTYTFNVVGEGDKLDTGELTFHFIPMPMVHWPDSMSSYLPARKILFSNDALGQHIGSGERIDTEVAKEKLMDCAQNYYANIVMPWGMQVTKLLGQVAQIEVDMVCPSHGVVLTTFLPDIIAAYARWASGATDGHQVTIVYDSMWGSTAEIAEKLREEYEASKHHVNVFSLADTHYSVVIGDLIESRYIFVGSSTRYNHMLPSVAGFLSYLEGLKPKDRVGLAFGAYGWSGESVDDIAAALSSMGFEMKDPIKVQWRMAPEHN